MARTAELNNLPVLSSYSEEEKQKIMGHLGALHALLRTAIPAEDPLPSEFTPHNLSAVRAMLDRAFLVPATDVKRTRDKRKAGLLVAVFSSPAFQAMMTVETIKRDALANAPIPAEVRAATPSLAVPLLASIPRDVVDIAIKSAFPGTTDEQIEADLRARKIETVNVGRGKHEARFPFATFEAWKREADAKAAAASKAETNGAAEKPSKAKATATA